MPSGFQVIHSSVGSIIAGKGKLKSETEGKSITATSHAVAVVEKRDGVERFWRLEELGIVSPEREEDEAALKMYQELIEWRKKEEERRKKTKRGRANGKS